MFTALVRAIVEGILRPLIAAWTQYLLGRRSVEKELAEAALRGQKEFDDALAKTHPTHVMSAAELRSLFNRERARREAAGGPGTAGGGGGSEDDDL